MTGTTSTHEGVHHGVALTWIGGTQRGPRVVTVNRQPSYMIRTTYGEEICSDLTRTLLTRIIGPSIEREAGRVRCLTSRYWKKPHGEGHNRERPQQQHFRRRETELEEREAGYPGYYIYSQRNLCVERAENLHGMMCRFGWQFGSSPLSSV